GVAVQLRLAAQLTGPSRDVTYVFYDCEEIEAERNGLLRLTRGAPELLRGDLAVLLEPTGGVLGGGCPGTLRAEVTARGGRGHRARGPRAPRALVAGAQRHPWGRRHPGRAAVLPPARARGGRAGLPRGAERGRDRRRGRQQCDPGRMRGHGELPVRPGPYPGG